MRRESQDLAGPTKHYSLKISSKSSTLYNSTPQVNPTTFVMIIDGHPKKTQKKTKSSDPFIYKY